MDALEQAQKCMEAAQTAYQDEVNLWIQDAKGYAAIASAAAAIAQVEQLKRIADALEFQLFEVAPRPAWKDPLDNF